MKKILLTLTLFLTIYTLRGQEQQRSEIIHRKFETELSIILTGPGTFLTPAIGYGIKRHSIYIAPVISFIDFDSYGLMSGYKFYPNGRLNRANLFFSYNFFYLKRIYYVSNSIYNVFDLANTMGYGFDLRLFKEFYVASEFGLGIQKRWGNYNNINNDWLFSPLLKVGLKKRFKK